MHYGHRLALCRVKTLTPDAYEEELVRFYRPDSKRTLIGCHTLSRGAKFEAIDLRIR